MKVQNATTRKDISELYYQLLAGGSKVRLFESMIDSNLAEILYHQKELSGATIIKKLNFQRFRGEKWLFLLSEAGFLKYNLKIEKYSLGSIFEKLIGQNTSEWWFVKEMTRSWQSVAYQDITAMLKGAEVEVDVNWPPKNELDTVSLEEWMGRTSTHTMKILEDYVDFAKISSLLDVGGGDGTMATTFVQKYSDLYVTIYNLKTACELAATKIKNLDLTNKVKPHIGNFLEDKKFPKGHDTILFSRVLCDWPEKVCLKLFEMSYRALPKGGQFIICEPFRESNKAFSLVWEYRYLFWDNFGKGVYKSHDKYVQMLKSVGFKPTFYSGVDKRSACQVLISRK